MDILTDVSNSLFSVKFQNQMSEEELFESLFNLLSDPFPIDNFSDDGFIGAGAFGKGVEVEDRLAIRWRFGQAD